MDILEVIKDRHPVNSMNNVDSNRKSSLVCHINDKLNSDRKRESKNNSKDSRSKTPDHRQNEKIPCTVPNIRYYNFFKHF